MATKIILCTVAALFQIIAAQVIGRGINGIYANVPALIENLPFPPYGPANINGIYGPANPMTYDIANVYGPAYPLAYDNIAYNYGPANAYEPIDNNMLTLGTLSASRGGSLAVRSSSSIPVKGIYVESDNMVIEGPLAVNGQLPFLGTIALEGALPALGNGAVAYGCGDGNVGILKEEFLPLAESLSPVTPHYGLVASGYGPVAAGYSPAAGPRGLGPYYRG